MIAYANQDDFQLDILFESAGIDALNAGDYTLAESLFEGALEEAEHLHLPKERMLSIMSNLASSYDINGKYTEADRVYTQILRDILSDSERDSEQFATFLKNYSNFLRRINNDTLAKGLECCAEIMESPAYRYLKDADDMISNDGFELQAQVA